MFVMGLKIAPDLGKHRDIIQELIKKRDTFRNFKNYEAADAIRKELLTKFNVELIDHKGFTVWKKAN